MRNDVFELSECMQNQVSNKAERSYYAQVLLQKGLFEDLDQQDKIQKPRNHLIAANILYVFLEIIGLFFHDCIDGSKRFEIRIRGVTLLQGKKRIYPHMKVFPSVLIESFKLICQYFVVSIREIYEVAFYEGQIQRFVETQLVRFWASRHHIYCQLLLDILLFWSCLLQVFDVLNHQFPVANALLPPRLQSFPYLFRLFLFFNLADRQLFGDHQASLSLWTSWFVSQNGLLLVPH